jgi:hypothetical protein
MSRNPQQPGFRGPGSVLGPGGGRATPSRGATVHRQGMRLLLSYCILSSIMGIQVLCAPEFRNDYYEKIYFYFSRLIPQELIIASFFLIKYILNPFSATFHV